MARQQLGSNPSNASDAIRKTDLDTAISGVSGSTGGGVPVTDNGDDTFTIAATTGNGAISIGQTNGLNGQKGLWIQTDASGNIVSFQVETTGNPTFPVWYNAVANRASQRAKWVAIGDSVTEGQGALARTSRWIDQALTMLRNSRPTPGNLGRGYIPSYYVHYMTQWNTADQGASSGSISNIDYVGNLGYRTAQLSQGASKTWNFYGTDIDILYTSANGGTFTWAIDGGTATTVTQSSSYRTDGIVQVNGLTQANHTLTIAATNNTNYFNGLTVYNGDRAKGIQMLDSGHFAHYVNSITGDSGGLTAFLGTLNLVGPDFLTVMFGINEYTQGTQPATFQSQYITLVNNLKTLTKVPNILLIIPYQVADSAVATRVGQWSDYVAAIRAVAANTSVGLLDLTAVMPKADTTGQGYYATDGIHPNDSGHGFIANAVVNAMGV